MQKALKKGLRLNEVNRKQIIAAIIAEKMGAELEALESYRAETTIYVERALVDRLSEEQGLEKLDLTQVPEGVMPTIKRLYLGEGYAQRENLVEFSKPVGVPNQFFSGGGIAHWEFKFTDEQTDVLRQFADKACDVEGRAKEMREAMMTFLNGFTSPQKLLNAAPDFEQYLPEDMYGDDDVEERVSLDDILGMTSAPKEEPKVEEPVAEEAEPVEVEEPAGEEVEVAPELDVPADEEVKKRGRPRTKKAA